MVFRKLLSLLQEGNKKTLPNLMQSRAISIWKNSGFGGLLVWLRWKIRLHSLNIEESYLDWVHHHALTESELMEQKKQADNLSSRPLISFITAVYNPPVPILKQTLDSVLSQTYDHWELCVVDGRSTLPGIHNILQEYADRDGRIHVQFLQENQGISGNTNKALEMAQGDYIALLDHDDLADPSMLFEVVQAIHHTPTADIIYYDEDKLSAEGNLRCHPFFKPHRWSPELLLSANYLTHCVLRRALVDEVGGFDKEMDGAQDWDLFFRVSEKAREIVHIPKVLYHWRQIAGSMALNNEAKPWVFENQLKAITAHLQRRGLPHPHVHFRGPGLNQVVWETRKQHVTIIIPTHNNFKRLQKCLHSLFDCTDYPSIEVIVVDCGSNKYTLGKYKCLFQQERVRFIFSSEASGSSQARNEGAKQASEGLLLFMGDHMEVFDSDWLTELVRWMQMEEIGVTGPKILSAQGYDQDGGMVISDKGDSHHPFCHTYFDYHGIYGSSEWYRNYSRVSALCFIVRRHDFNSVDGFDPHLHFPESDYDLQKRITESGHRILYTPCSVIKDTQKSRATSGADILSIKDPYFHPHLALKWNIPLLKLQGNSLRRQQ